MVDGGIGVPYPRDVDGEFADEGAADHGDPPAEEVVREADRLGDAARGVGGACAEGEQLVVDGEDGPPVHALVAAVGVPAVDGLAAERGRDQEGAVGAGAVGQSVGEHQVEQQLGLGAAGACRHAGQEVALAGLVEVVRGDPGVRGQAPYGVGVGGVVRGPAGVEDQQMDLDVEVVGGVDGFRAEGRDRLRAVPVGGQGQADAAHAASPVASSVAPSVPASACQDLRPSSLAPSSVSSAGP